MFLFDGPNTLSNSPRVRYCTGNFCSNFIRRHFFSAERTAERARARANTYPQSARLVPETAVDELGHVVDKMHVSRSNPHTTCAAPRAGRKTVDELHEAYVARGRAK